MCNDWFETEGTTFTIRARCAPRARAQGIGDLRFVNRPVGAIAIDAGFGTLSYFNHSFRAPFGASPSDVRRRRGEQLPLWRALAALKMFRSGESVGG